MKDITNTMLDLYTKPKNYQFSEEEIKTIMKIKKKRDMNGKYCIYKKESYKNLYIAFMIDQEPYAARRSGVLNHWEVICERQLSNEEYLEAVRNFGCNIRRFIVYQYRDIEKLVEEDLLYGVKTPDLFIEKCKKLGYSRHFNKNKQLNFEF